MRARAENGPQYMWQAGGRLDDVDWLAACTSLLGFAHGLPDVEALMARTVTSAWRYRYQGMRRVRDPAFLSSIIVIGFFCGAFS